MEQSLVIFGGVLAVLFIGAMVWYAFMSLRIWFSGRPSKLSQNSAKRAQFEGQFQDLLQFNSLQAREFLRAWVLGQARERGQILVKDVQCLRDRGQLAHVDGLDYRHPSDAEWRLADVVGANVFFRGDLTFAGYVDYNDQIGEIGERVLEQKGLPFDDAVFLRRVHCLPEVKMWCGFHGSPEFPYPTVRYRIQHGVEGGTRSFFLDGMLNLLVVLQSDQKGRPDVRWERPYARQPDFYRPSSKD